MVYWLALKAIPARGLLGVAALAIGLQLIGVDVVNPFLDLGASLLDDLAGWIESQFTPDWVFW